MNDRDRTHASKAKCRNHGARKPNLAITIDTDGLKLNVPKQKDNGHEEIDAAKEYRDDDDRSGAKIELRGIQQEEVITRG